MVFKYLKNNILSPIPTWLKIFRNVEAVSGHGLVLILAKLRGVLVARFRVSVRLGVFETPGRFAQVRHHIDVIAKQQVGGGGVGTPPVYGGPSVRYPDVCAFLGRSGPLAVTKK